MENNFGIGARVLAMAVDLLVHQSIIAKGEVMERIMSTAFLYEELDAQLHIQVEVQLFRDGITLYYTRIREYLEGNEKTTPPRITTTQGQSISIHRPRRRNDRMPLKVKDGYGISGEVGSHRQEN